VPAMTLAEALETTCSHCIAGLASARTAVVTTRPCRAPHHPISDAGLLGGGHVPMPAEVSLAHHRVRFLDELSECRRHLLTVLRQPLAETVLSMQSPERPRPHELRRLSATGAAREGCGPSPSAVHPPA
jgi:magnesium chelatase family protein